jgi:hypothetical protein
MSKTAIAVVVLLLVLVGAGSALASHYTWKNEPTPQNPTVTNQTVLSLAAVDNTTPAAMEERLRTASNTCDIFKAVGHGFGYLSNLCRFNIVNGDPWWRDMPPRQIRDVATALILATS